MSSQRLPDELIREICLLAAVADNHVGFILTQVAHRVKNWVEPIVYNHLVYDKERTGSQRHFPIHHRPIAESISSFGHHVRHLLLSGSEDPITSVYLKYCTSAVDVAIWGDRHLPWEIVKFILANFSFHRFSGEPWCLFTKAFVSSPAFATLTHLDQRVACVGWPEFKAVTELPNLTHLSVDPCVELELIDGSLAGCKKLQIFVLLATGWHLDDFDSYEEWWKQSRSDKRIVCVAVANQENNWLQFAKGGKDMWAMAEEKCETWIESST
ncbi:hypothetical protein BDN72DRAFT_845774 [Pluteus cervinus]|uniref:Uncharacterized protein n=1 Tax=Pluteus cervinus TaxID=181527 RepID=A0ACD3AK43_9AGAR|nr:hypothetical protein BDN72DRAFT_845774 [Pluteus cervinus]